jgi:hypothetical protein
MKVCKAYNEYMNNISVSDTLHRKIVSYATNTKSIRRPSTALNIAKRYVMAFACFAVVMLSIAAISWLMRHNSILVPGNNTPGNNPPGNNLSENNPSVSQSGEDSPVPDSSSKYAPGEHTLFFNKADSLAAAKIAISGHFWQELTDEEVKAIFPALIETYNITATANFQSNENGVSLLNIDAHAVSASGLKAYIQLAPDEVVLDYKFDVEAKFSDVLGTEVIAGYFEIRPNSKGQKNAIYFASFKLSGIAYYVELGGAEAEKEILEDEISKLIGLLIAGGSADLGILHPVVPELCEDRLNLDEARLDADFGAYLPATLPEGFVFEDALRFINQERNELNIYWTKGMGYIDWHVSYPDDNDKARITSVADRKNYDLSLYPIPRAGSVPNDLREIVSNPIFLIEELTLDVVQARAYEIADSGDEPGARMRFGVLYGDILVELSVKGTTPKAVFDILQQLKKGEG